MRDETMQCPNKTGEGIEVILAYQGGRLAPETAAQMEAHLEQCQDCQELLLAQNVVFDALDDWKPEPISPGFDRDLYARIETEEASRGWWRSLIPALFWKPAMVVAAACLVLVAGLLMRPVATIDTGELASAEPLDIEQIEQVVEDLDMLYMLDPTALGEEETDEVPAEEGVGVVTLSFEVKRCG
jgi:anti-sigma factor RsiW